MGNIILIEILILALTCILIKIHLLDHGTLFFYDAAAFNWLIFYSGFLHLYS